VRHRTWAQPLRLISMSVVLCPSSSPCLFSCVPLSRKTLAFQNAFSPLIFLFVRKKYVMSSGLTHFRLFVSLPLSIPTIRLDSLFRSRRPVASSAIWRFFPTDWFAFFILSQTLLSYCLSAVSCIFSSPGFSFLNPPGPAFFGVLAAVAFDILPCSRPRLH